MLAVEQSSDSEIWAFAQNSFCSHLLILFPCFIGLPWWERQSLSVFEVVVVLPGKEEAKTKDKIHV